jgi:hypothetical protein
LLTCLDNYDSIATVTSINSHAEDESSLSQFIGSSLSPLSSFDQGLAWGLAEGSSPDSSESLVDTTRSAPDQISEPDERDCWASPAVAMAHAQIPQPHDRDIRASAVAAIASVQVPLDFSCIDSIPQPDANDAWANVSSAPAQIPHIDDYDSWASAVAAMAHAQIPHPDDRDSWASAAGTASIQVPLDFSCIDNIPQPDANDAWANVAPATAQTPPANASGSCICAAASAPAQIPQTDDYDSWAGVVAAMAQAQIPQPDDYDSWASVVAAMAQAQIPQSDDRESLI